MEMTDECLQIRMYSKCATVGSTARLMNFRHTTRLRVTDYNTLSSLHKAMERLTSTSYTNLEKHVRDQENYIHHLKISLKDIKRTLQRSESQKRTLQSLLENKTLNKKKEKEESFSSSKSLIVQLTMDLTLEDELQQTVDALRKTQEEYQISQCKLTRTEAKLRATERDLEESKDCIEGYNHEILFIQAELQYKTQELEEVQNLLQDQNESLVNFQRHLAALKYNRWRMVLGLMSARTLVALSVERVQHLEARLLVHDLTSLDLSACRGGSGDAADVPRVPTPSLPHCRSSSPRPHTSAADNYHPGKTEEAVMTENSVSLELQNHVTWLESQLHEAELDRQQERSELGDELQCLEEEVSSLREERVRQTLMEERLLHILRLMRSLLDVKISRRTIGNMVVEALQCSVEPGTRDVSSLRFLNHLHRNTVECERVSTEGLIRLALQACSEV